MRPLDPEVRISRKRRRFLWRTRWSGHDTNIENRRRSRELRCFSISSSTAPSKSSAVTVTFCHKHAYFPNGAAILLADFARSWTHFRRWIRRAAPREHTNTNMCLLCGAPAANTPLPQQPCRNRSAARARRPPRSGTGSAGPMKATYGVSNNSMLAH